MARARRLDLTLLLAVAPLVASCGGGAEERHCVGADGRYLEDRDCDPQSPTYRQSAHWVYVPHRYYGGAGTHAGGYVSATSPGRGSSGVARGGFGSTGTAHAGGGHGAGG
ncbi:MAG TPA: hypothetical protein VFP50_10805 [Anaeromyxobacteraceae bacterium]|nr:hypothetical protein [Anaeromyxobacteraceae bacterium]